MGDPTGPLRVAGTVIGPGERRRFDAPVSRLPTGAPVTLPLAVSVGRAPGPRIWLAAAVHGDELNGVEIIRRVWERLDLDSLHGAVIAVPILNVMGFVTRSRYLPDRRDLNRSFPGSPRGSFAARIAHLFHREVVEQCAYGIDLHSGSDRRTNLPQIRADLDDPEARRLALAFGSPVVLHARLRDGSLRSAAGKAGAHALVYEGGEAGRFDETAIGAGVGGVLRVMAALGMGVDPPVGGVSNPFEARRSRWVRANRGGILRLEANLGNPVAKGAVLGVIADPLGENPVHVKSPLDGVVVGRTNHPLVYRGDALCNIAEQ